MAEPEDREQLRLVIDAALRVMPARNLIDDLLDDRPIRLDFRPRREATHQGVAVAPELYCRYVTHAVCMRPVCPCVNSK